MASSAFFRSASFRDNPISSLANRLVARKPCNSAKKAGLSCHAESTKRLSLLSTGSGGSTASCAKRAKAAGPTRARSTPIRIAATITSPGRAAASASAESVADPNPTGSSRAKTFDSGPRAAAASWAAAQASSVPLITLSFGLKRTVGLTVTPAPLCVSSRGSTTGLVAGLRAVRICPPRSHECLLRTADYDPHERTSRRPFRRRRHPRRHSVSARGLLVGSVPPAWAARPDAFFRRRHSRLKRKGPRKGPFGFHVIYKECAFGLTAGSR